MTGLSAEQVTSWRLSKHHLAERAEKSQLTKVVEDVCGIQAQVLSGASIAIWARVEGVSAQDIEDALWKQHTLVKTWAMRGTLHLLTATDLPLYVAALKTRLKDMKDQLVRNYKLGPGEMERVVSDIHDALDGRCLNRAQIAERVAAQSKIRGPNSDNCCSLDGESSFSLQPIAGVSVLGQARVRSPPLSARISGSDDGVNLMERRP